MSKELDDLEILEGNKLIAEFEGRATVINECEYCGKDVTVKPICSGDEKGNKTSHAAGGRIVELKYHSSWNWLMPVWKKFREINYDYPNGIKRDDLKNEHEHFRELIIGSLEICSIKMAFRYIVYAIKWYNQQQSA